MFDLKKVTKGRREDPPRITLYSADGLGKSGFAAGSNEPFFVDADKGSLKYDVSRVLVDSWDDAVEAVTAVESGQIKCKTLVLDSVTALETLSHAKLFGADTIGTFGGGYGRGEDLAMQEWRILWAQIERIWMQGKTIILCAHATVRSFDDPVSVTGKYDRMEMSVRPRLAGFLRQRSDFVFYVREEVVTAKPKGQSTRATTTGIRYMYTKRTPAYDAKARGTSMFPERILLSWSDFEAACKADAKRGGELMKEIDEMLAEIGDPDLTREAKAYIKAYPSEIVSASNRVTARLEEFRLKAAAGQPPTQQPPTTTPDAASSKSATAAS